MFGAREIALLQLKHNFNNHPMYLQDWVDESYSDCCQWQSVLCNATTSRVIAIDLLSLNIASALYLNVSLFTPFQQLESLDLSGNNIAGCVENEGIYMSSNIYQRFPLNKFVICFLCLI